VSGSGEDIERRFREMMMRQTPAARLVMACRMFSTGKALVRAGLSQSHDGETLNFRQRLFLRLYGRDFSPSERDRILTYLGTV
jgi:hypothetical protein